MTLPLPTATPQDAGLAVGLVNTIAKIGALGLAVLATVSADQISVLMAQHRPSTPPPSACSKASP